MRMNRFILLSAVVFLAVQANGGERVVATDSSAPRRFTLDEAILTALQRNPTLLIAEQEIKRTQGVIIQLRAEVLPHITARGEDDWIDPNLQRASILGTTITGTIPGGTASVGDSAPSQVQDVHALGVPAS